jgi:PAS domain S-box-containing protein
MHDVQRVSPPPPSRLRYDQRVLLLGLLAALPGALVSLIVLWTGDYSPKVQWTLTVVIAACYLGFSYALRDRVVLPLQTLSNLLAALREGDFSIRARASHPDDPLGEVMVEVNALVETLRDQRLGALEATALLRKVMAETDVAVFTFDGERRLQLVNRAGQRLLGQPAERLLGRTASELDLDDCLAPGAPRVMAIAFPGGSGRWEIRRSEFRQGGLPHTLLVLSDVSEPLREEERQAWQRLIRVLGHELNNSLAPIKSIAGSLEQLVGRESPPPDWREDLRRGLAVIGSRSEALGRFMSAYARLARLPPPSFAALPIGDLVRRVARLEARIPILLREGPPATLLADSDQLEQALINLLRNAVDAALETGGRVSVGWRIRQVGGSTVEVWIEDEGPGLTNTGNLFVPFFTTKPTGSGIGLVLSRQIVEAHGGTLTLENRTAGRGCVATLQLPL